MGIPMEHEGLPLPMTQKRSLNRSSSTPVSSSGSPTGGADVTHKPSLLRSDGVGSRCCHHSHSNTGEHDEEAATTTRHSIMNKAQHSQQQQPFVDAISLDGSDTESASSSSSQYSHDSHSEQQQPFLNNDSNNNNSSSSSNNNNNGDDPPADLTPTNICGYAKLLRDDIFDYLHLLRSNRAFRLFLCSYVFGHMGEWFTYIASISLMERMLGGDDNEHSRTSIGVLVMIRLLPTVLLAPFGGVLADSRDRRKSMIVLDLIGACTPVLFILATFLEGQSSAWLLGKHGNLYGVAMIYLATVCQECVCALYEPCRTSIVPLLVTGNDNDLKKATTLTGVAWSAVAAFGSALGGFATSYFGARTCFCKSVWFG